MEVGKIRMLSPPFENLINSFVGSDGAENQGDGLFLVEFECGSGSAFKDRRSEWWRQISEGNGDNFFRWDGKALADDLAGSLRVNEDASGEAIGRPGISFLHERLPGVVRKKIMSRKYERVAACGEVEVEGVA